MNQFHKLFRWAWSILVVCTLAFAMGGCDGDDGAQGPAGPTGPTGPAGADGADGPPGPGAEITPLESCSVCHSDGSFASAPAAHAVTGIASVSNVGFVDNAGDLEVSFVLAFDGVAAADAIEVDSAYIHTAVDSTTIRLDLAASPIPVVPGAGAGEYTATIAGGTALAGDAARFYLRLINTAGTRAVVSGDYPAEALPTIVNDASCTNCHGPKGLAPHAGFGYPGMEASECVVCHKDEAGIWAPGGVPRFQDPFVGIVHGIHNAHNMPDGYSYGGEEFETTYPTYMTNCSVCHTGTDQLAAANAMPVSGAGCLTCHGAMDNADWDFSGGLEFHLTQPADIDCASATCHAVTGAANTLVAVTDFHNGVATERAGVIWNGVDAAVTEADRFTWQITGIVDDGVDLAISWTATYDGAGVDPCNDTVGAAAPVFFLPGGGSGGTFSMLRNYAQGEDFILGQADSPGEPTSVNLTVDNTTCAGLVATTTIPVEAVGATVGRVAIQGKPGVVSPADATALLRVRVPTPTFDWLLGTNNPAPARRGVVDNDLCLGCHVGSLYQHGGNRVDNVDVCMMCHNAASNEQDVRVGMGVDASEAYDGKVGETYELKTMLHRIHSANKDIGEAGPNPPYLVYRNRGIYAFAAHGDIPPNWPGTGQQVVYGSDPAFTTNHNYHSPTFPRAINDCSACHVDGFAVIPDQAVAMANTVDVGGTVDYGDQLDDVLQGAATTACVTCHYNSAARGHAYQNSWTPQDFPMGRQSIIDAAN